MVYQSRIILGRLKDFSRTVVKHYLPWSIDVSNKQLSLMTKFLLRAIATTLAKIRQICSLKILHGNIELGGRGKMVESDESMFGHKTKCNCCQVSEGA